MGAIDPGDKKSFDVHLNIVPFIDLLSCLTAFLLVAAVWSNHAQLSATPRARGTPDFGDPAPQISVLVERDRIYIGVTSLLWDPVIATAHAGEHDWATVAATLAALRKEAAFVDRKDLEIGVESTGAQVVPYRDLIAVMDLAAAAGFDRIKVMAPGTLSWQPEW